jgi:plastocyanin
MASSPGLATGQSLLERPPNLSGGWVAPPGVLQFDFVHRFEASPSPERKVTSFPSFVLAAGLPHRTMLGFFYSTNSTLVARYPNEWEFFAQAAPMQQDSGRPLDIGIEAGYNLAAEGFVGELSLARRAGRVRLLAVGRLLADPGDDPMDVAVGGGAVVRLGRWVALAGDVVTVLERSAGEEVAWSAGLQLGIPHTPHTLSLQASNTIGVSLESASRGTGQTLYGFEFTIPITLKRYLGGGTPPSDSTAPSAGGGQGVAPIVHIKNLAYGSGTLTIPAGTTVQWVNDDPLAHTVVAVDTTFDSGLIEPGASWRHLFAVPGTYAYTCRPHPFMKGTIIVVARP